MKKYNVIILTVIKINPSDASFDRRSHSTASKHLLDALEEGYEIYKAIPLVTNHSALIEYILRQEVDTHE